jgi:hypothetical protein
LACTPSHSVTPTSLKILEKTWQRLGAIKNAHSKILTFRYITLKLNDQEPTKVMLLRSGDNFEEIKYARTSSISTGRNLVAAAFGSRPSLLKVEMGAHISDSDHI